MPLPVRVIEFILERLDPLVWKAQRFGSKTEIGLFFYSIGAFLAGGTSLFNMLLVSLMYVRPELRLLRWAKKHADEPCRGVVPLEYAELLILGLRNWTIVGISVGIFGVVGFLVLFGTPDPNAPPYVPGVAMEVLFGFQLVPGWFYPLGWFSMGLGYFVLAARPRPRSERFSFTRWLKDRWAHIPTPVRLEIRR